MVDDGMHAGDMPNIHVPENGNLDQEILNTRRSVDYPGLLLAVSGAYGRRILACAAGIESRGAGRPK